MASPIELHYWPTPNGWKITLMLEELGVPYRVNFVDITKGEQFAPAFLRISPNNRIPAPVDPQGPEGAPLSIFESGAILQYLGRKFRQNCTLRNCTPTPIILFPAYASRCHVGVSWHARIPTCQCLPVNPLVGVAGKFDDSDVVFLNALAYLIRVNRHNVLQVL